MPHVKTAVSLDSELFAALESLAKSENLTRSAIVEQALQQYLERHRSAKIKEQLDRVHASDEQDDQGVVHASKRRSGSTSGEW